MALTHRDACLSPDEIQAFFDVGWITRRALFNAGEVSRMQACFHELELLARQLTRTRLHRGAYFVLDENRDDQVIKRVVWAGGCKRYLLTISNDPRLTIPCAQLLHSEAMDQLINQAHFKRPHDGVTFDWHQDIEHRDKGNGTWTDVNGCGSFVQTLIVLDEMTADNGPLYFMPGSARWGRIGFGDDQWHQAELDKQRQAQCREDNAVMVTAQPGDVLFFGPYTAHASFENTSEHYRRVLINGYASPGANSRVYPGAGTGRRVVAPIELPAPGADRPAAQAGIRA